MGEESSMNHVCQVSGIKLLLKKNYKIQIDTIDIDSLVDTTLSFSENWSKIKSEYVTNCFCSCCGQYVK
jgi:hypothetical protein